MSDEKHKIKMETNKTKVKNKYVTRGVQREKKKTHTKKAAMYTVNLHQYLYFVILIAYIPTCPLHVYPL